MQRRRKQNTLQMTEMSPSPAKRQKHVAESGEQGIRIKRMRNFKETEEKLSVVKFSAGMKTLFNEMREKTKKPLTALPPQEGAP